MKPELVKRDNDATWRYLREAWRRCPFCRSTPAFHYIRQYMDMHFDGQLWCGHCEAYIAMWDEKEHRLEGLNVR